MVKWKGYGWHKISWVKAADMSAPHMIKKFEEEEKDRAMVV